MKANLMKISVLATALIFLLAGASLAQNGNSRSHRKDDHSRHIRSSYNGQGHHAPSHLRQNRYETPRRHNNFNDRHLTAYRTGRHPFRHHEKYCRRVYRHDYHYRHKPSYNLFSFRMPAFQPGWSVIIKTKSRW